MIYPSVVCLCLSCLNCFATPSVSSVSQSCPTLWNPMDCSTPGLPVHHQLRELTQTLSIESVRPYNHCILCHPFLLFGLNLSQHQGLFQGVHSSHQVAKVLEFSFSISPSNEYSGLISFRIDWCDLAVQGTLKSLLQHHSSKASILRSLLTSVLVINPEVAWPRRF